MAKTIFEGIFSKEMPKSAEEFKKILLNSENVLDGSSKSAREWIIQLFDEGTFTEIGAYISRRTCDLSLDGASEFESVICGYGAINGCLAYVFAEDMSRTKGAVSEASAEKICDIYRLAVDNGAPVIGVFNSAGAYIPEGVRSLGGYGKIMKASAKASGIVPQIAIAAGVVQGASAVIASMFDFVIAIKKSKISVNPAFVVGGGTVSDSVESGIVSVCAETEDEAISSARQLLTYIPSNNEDGGAEIYSEDSPDRQTTGSEYDMSRNIVSLISEISDDGKYLELSGEYAKCISTGFISLYGMACGVVATNYSENEGRLTSKGARKAAKFISFCDCFDIPVVTFVDTEGYMVDGAEEKNPFAAEIAKLAGQYATARVPLVTLVAGSAYGSVFSVFGSKSIGADVVFALDTAKISCMNASSAVALMYNDQISGDVTREKLEDMWNMKEANVIEAAKCGAVDDIIDRAEMRQRLTSALMMLSRKAAGASHRRHANMPL